MDKVKKIAADFFTLALNHDYLTIISMLKQSYIVFYDHLTLMKG